MTMEAQPSHGEWEYRLIPASMANEMLTALLGYLKTTSGEVPFVRPGKKCYLRYADMSSEIKELRTIVQEGLRVQRDTPQTN